jgi:hypothetical protein
MVAQLNVTVCDMPCSWLTRTAPPICTLAGHDGGIWDRTQSWVICATEPGQYGDRVPAGTRPGPGCSRQPHSLAEPGNSRGRAVSVPPVSVPARSVTGWPDQGGERGPGHGGACTTKRS